MAVKPQARCGKAVEFPQSLLLLLGQVLPGKDVWFWFCVCLLSWRGEGDRSQATTIAQHAVRHGWPTLDIDQFAGSQLVVGVHSARRCFFFKLDYVCVSVSGACVLLLYILLLSRCPQPYLTSKPVNDQHITIMQRSRWCPRHRCFAFNTGGEERAQTSALAKNL